MFTMVNFFFQHYFTVLLHKSETFALMEQLTNLAMKQLIDDSTSFVEDRDLLNKLRFLFVFFFSFNYNLKFAKLS